MPEPLFINATSRTPLADFDAGKASFVLNGKSFPENAFSFYQPILHWIELYCAEPNENTVLDIKLLYCNSSSAKQIVKILLQLEALSFRRKVLVRWYYMED
ncbi:MAG: DUF1987 domain-containing protein, partial [Bacteroidetes bacterium]|nr:DUF1987 domain-containing protein [Bacteroidota bacterium]